MSPAGEEKMKLRYQIHSVSAMTLLGYGENWIDRYRFRLNESETKRCIIRADDEQEDNALFYQIMCVLHDGKFPELENGSVCRELSDVIFFMDFSSLYSSAERLGFVRYAAPRLKLAAFCLLEIDLPQEIPAHLRILIQRAVERAVGDKLIHGHAVRLVGFAELRHRAEPVQDLLVDGFRDSLLKCVLR